MQVDRRTFLRWSGVTALALAASCSSTTKHTGGATTTTTSHSGGPPPWSKLSDQLSGKLVLPNAPGFSADARLFDPRFDVIVPQAIAFCENPTDVQRCIGFARTNDVPFTARSGGHSYAGYSTIDGLVVDVTQMSNISVDGNHATIGAGARLIDVYSRLNGQGVSIPAGSCPSVGIAGLALGGGIGVVGRKYGLTCDALTGVQLVTADGRTVTADASTNDDLFWACRGGGGGNFGIATSFDFATFPTRDLALFTLKWPWSAAADVLPAWMTWVGTTPDEMWANCILEAPLDPATGPVLQVAGIFVGDQAPASALIGQLLSTVGAAPTTNFIESTPFAHAMFVEAGCADLGEAACHVQGQTPSASLTRSPSFAGSAYVDAALGDAGVAAVVGGIQQRITDGQPGAIAFDAYGGAINRIAPDATAFVHRNSLACAQFSVSYNTSDPPALVAQHQQWLESYRASLAAYTGPGAYQNYIDPTLADWQDAYYGANLKRLEKVKKQWDPDNTLHFAQSIPPA